MAKAAPLAFDQLVMQITWRCTAACAMCYQSAGPKGSDDLGDAALSLADATRAIEAATAVPNLAPHYHLVGGEALIRMDDSLTLIGATRDAGFLRISLTTNGYWARRREAGAEAAAALRRAGLTHMDLSWDQWRRPFIPPGAMSNALEAAAAAGIQVRLRLLTDRNGDPEDALSDLRADAIAATHEILVDSVAATGRARAEIDAEAFYAHGDLSAACHRSLSLTVNPAGEVYPCCSGLDQTQSLRFGNAREEPLDQIVERMCASQLLRRIVFEGVGALTPILIAADAMPEGRASSICSLCWSIFRDPKSVAALAEAFPDERWAS